jgi:hypothetical protein
VRRIPVDVLEHLRFAHEEGSVDPTFARLRLLRELDDAVAVEVEVANAAGRTAVIVRNFPCERWSTATPEIDVESPSPQVSMNVSSPVRLEPPIRPPVWVS